MKKCGNRNNHRKEGSEIVNNALNHPKGDHCLSRSNGTVGNVNEGKKKGKKNHRKGHRQSTTRHPPFPCWCSLGLHLRPSIQHAASPSKTSFGRQDMALSRSRKGNAIQEPGWINVAPPFRILVFQNHGAKAIIPGVAHLTNLWLPSRILLNVASVRNKGFGKFWHCASYHTFSFTNGNVA